MKLHSTVNKLIIKTVNNYFILLKYIKYNKIKIYFYFLIIIYINFIFDHNQNKHDK